MDDEGALMALSAIFIGTAGVATGIVGVVLPSGRRLEALLAPVVGIGAGIVILGIGGYLSAVREVEPIFMPRMFLVGSIVGWAFVAATLWALVRRQGRVSDDG